jgi:hypothetical protein
MRVHWKNLFTRLSLWLAGEILLNLIGLDSLADYSEFLLEHHETMIRNSSVSMLYDFPKFNQLIDS